MNLVETNKKIPSLPINLDSYIHFGLRLEFLLFKFACLIEFLKQVLQFYKIHTPESFYWCSRWKRGMRLSFFKKLLSISYQLLFKRRTSFLFVLQENSSPLSPGAKWTPQSGQNGPGQLQVSDYYITKCTFQISSQTFLCAKLRWQGSQKKLFEVIILLFQIQITNFFTNIL